MSVKLRKNIEWQRKSLSGQLLDNAKSKNFEVKNDANMGQIENLSNSFTHLLKLFYTNNNIHSKENYLSHLHQNKNSWVDLCI